MKPYNHLVGYLHRFKLLTLGRFKIRLHSILDVDKTCWYHDHPFHHMSIIVSGGYTEKVLVGDYYEEYEHTKGSVIFSDSSRKHRIVKVLPNTKTLFFTWYNDSGWDLYRDHSILLNGFEDGVYKTKLGYRKCVAGKWYKATQQQDDASKQTRLSVNQVHPCAILIGKLREVINNEIS